MSLPRNFDKHLLNSFGYHAVWKPGRAFVLGDVMVRKDGAFHEGGHVSDFSNIMREKPEPPIQLSLMSSKSRQIIVQAGVEIDDPLNLKPDVNASVKYEFSGKSQYILKTPKLLGSSIDNMLLLAKDLAVHPDWKHGKYFLISEIYGGEQWSFIGNEATTSSFGLSGSGAGILSFLNIGASIGLTKTGKADVECLGESGMLAMKLVRIDKDGSLNHGN